MSNRTSYGKPHNKPKTIMKDKIVYGEEGPKIINFATSQSYDIIIIGSRGMSSLKEAFLGSTSNFVLHKSKVPVLIVK